MRNRSAQIGAFPAVLRRAAFGTVLVPELHLHDGQAGAPAAVQGEVGGAQRRAPGPVRLPCAASRRHNVVQGDARAGRRRPGAALAARTGAR